MRRGAPDCWEGCSRPSVNVGHGGARDKTGRWRAEGCSDASGGALPIVSKCRPHGARDKTGKWRAEGCSDASGGALPTISRCWPWALNKSGRRRGGMLHATRVVLPRVLARGGVRRDAPHALERCSRQRGQELCSWRCCGGEWCCTRAQRGHGDHGPAGAEKGGEQEAAETARESPAALRSAWAWPLGARRLGVCEGTAISTSSRGGAGRCHVSWGRILGVVHLLVESCKKIARGG